MKGYLKRLIAKDEEQEFRDFIFHLSTLDKQYLLRNDILLEFDEMCQRKGKDDHFREKSTIARFLNHIPEILRLDGSIYIMHRYAIAKYRIYQLNFNGDLMDEISKSEFLNVKDIYVQGQIGSGGSVPLEIDFMPFYDYSPDMRDSRNIGNGIRFLNKHLSSSLFQKRDEWGRKLFDFLKLHKINGNQLLINKAIHSDLEEFLNEMESTLNWLGSTKPETPYSEVEGELKRRGFEAGLGKTAGRIREALQNLYDLFNEANAPILEDFISRIPMISRIAIISPHGWFGQENVLGRPDTGGQVIYILDQVRALEKYLIDEFEKAGIELVPKIVVLTRQIPNAGNTTCDQHREKIYQTENSWILRVPFRTADGDILQDWVSRFKIWPYVDQFAADSERELAAEFDGKPDLVIGNYSDGNLVASLLADTFNVTQCTIAHALEKTKYLFSDLYWQEMESDYNFSLHFTSDMLAMNKSDFVITSTYQEIAGTETELGQYESYQFFTMPGLYQVVSGVNLFNPKFNIVPPGVDEQNYFPYTETKRRIAGKTEFWENRLFADAADDIYGHLNEPDKRPIFTMARFDKIKNITGLIEAFGQSEKLRGQCNLIFAAGTTRIEDSHDIEEQEQIRLTYQLIDRYHLHGSIRWLPSINKVDTGEVYRIIADRGGMFVQPALFEAFGLTVLEAMLSGLPTFATQFGGPSEIIEDRRSGYLLNTSKPELMAAALEQFIADCDDDSELWERISKQGIRRVKKHFTWDLYSQKLISLTKLYGFWRYTVAGEGMLKLDRYCDLLYHLLFKDRAKRLY